MKLKSSNYKSHWNILVLCEYVPGKNAWFDFNSIVWVLFSHKTEKFRFWKSWINLTIFDKERYVVRFEYVSRYDVWFCSISIVWFHFIHKTEISMLKVIKIFFDKKWCKIWLCPVKQCLTWFKLRCLGKILALGWEYKFQILLK